MKKALTPVARRLRSDPTEVERHLWHVLRAKSLGVKFRRQAVIGRYIVDFVCFEKKLVIEGSMIRVGGIFRGMNGSEGRGLRF
ncbi:MAG: hypothetical protein UT33_C0004G0005 [Candidatus Peregrinibacteria bacterium GW2011_GWC2_39_14]|nr:MAG: hypothetical protein UT33_C0004G0005 [Candidatus Peregrinibacteria bacterium GW2011_GWC2_39_14]